ncbi:hypothetical protein TTHERM_00678270 (macronuclear) [Tetrahymena thermophila SB210]|uniref:Transmembrane protein n=1 Tax=Tetrahymena thermophila (strain SB210) TaxID=312017 RepID=I7MB39_TETTS|nr:hypothetical protein TTHERM_00678270 [Tetrahymena thermophila SB210]EAS07561.2 hypothetical protein TTHERM_00678270 [Tetrahymena thermophila SB210]|eukprot:XP_001027803.2 hypothetical protein TTHERM_00678270 [Tetrahymena thermophila SB210]
MIIKLKSLLFYLVTFIQLQHIKFVICGAIEVQDYQLDYTNLNAVTQMTFIFRLQSGLGAGNFLRLSFPQKIFATSITKVVVQYSYQGTNGCSSMQTLPAIINLDGSSQTDYLISFLNDISQPVDLQASPNWYALYIYPEAGTIFNQGIQKPIQARTQSIDTVAALYGTPIIYDVTDSFAVLEFDSSPSTAGITASAIFSPQYASVNKLPGSQYEVSVIVIPNTAILNGARIVLRITNDQNYKFLPQCISEENITPSQTTPPLDPSQYKCTLDSNKNRIIILINQGLVVSQIYRFRVTVQNPSYVSPQQAQIEVRTMLLSSNKIIELKVIPAFQLSVSLLQVQQKVIMGNGIDLSDPNYQNMARILAGQNFYNPFTFQFMPNFPTPDKTKLRVTFKITVNSMLNDAILTGSIQHNLPRFDINTPVNCVLNTLAANYEIKCDNVGPLTSTNWYYSTARVYFQNSGVNIDSYFGSVQIWTVDSSGNAVTLVSISMQNFVQPLIKPNQQVIDTTTTTYGYQLVHTQPSQDASGNQLSLSPISQNSAGIKFCTNKSLPQKLVFTLNSGLTGQFGGGTNQAFRLIGSPLIQANPGQIGSQFYVESTNPGCTISSSFPSDANRMITTYTTYTDILFASGGSSTCMSQGGATSTFSIGDVFILSHGSSYAGRDGFDFYGSFYSNYVDNTSIPNSWFAVNANTISVTGSACTLTNLQYINIVLSNYQTSSGAQTQIADGTKYTAFIRVTGYLTAEEMVNAKRIAVFFNNVNFYSIGLDSYGQMMVSCSSSMNTNQKCWGYSGQINQSQSFHSMKRVEFDISPFIAQTGSSSPFQLLIPVQAIPNLNLQRLQVAVLVDNPYFGHQTQAYQISKTMPGYTILTGSIQPYYATLADLSYQLVVSTRTQGAVDDAQLNIGHSLTVPTINQNNPNNDPINIGAAFVIVGNWQMYTNTLAVATTSVVNTNVMSEHCLPFSYQTGGVQKYGIFCPFTYKDTSITVSPTTSVTFNNFKYPAQGPLKLSGTYISWSQNNGALISVLQDSTSITQTLNANLIYNVKSLILRRYIQYNRVQWYFTTTNPFPGNGKITINLNDSGNPWGFQVYAGNLAACILQLQFGTFSTSACSVSVSTINIIFTFSYSGTFPAGSYILNQYGFQSPSTSLSKTYAITITTSNAVGNIDQSNGSATLTFDNNVALNTAVDQIKFQFTHSLISNSVGNLDLFFRINSRPILALATPNPGAGLIAGQYVQIQISQLVGQESTTQCSVMQNSVTYFGFKSIDSSNANQIRLFPRNDILTESLTFQLHCLNVINTFSASPTFKIDLDFNDGAVQTVITGTLSPTGVSNPSYTTPAALTSATLSKFNGLAGSKLHYKFQLTFSATGVTQSSAIFLHFPLKFNHLVGSSSLSCQVNGKVVYCYNFIERCILVTAFPLNIAAGTQFTLEVYGVYAPLNAAGAANIQISLSKTTSPDQVVEQINVSDAATLSDSTSSLYIVSTTLSDMYSREQNNYQFTINSLSAISSGSNIYIEYPSEYGTSIAVSPPTTCNIQSTNLASVYGQGCNIFGSNILISVSTNIPIGSFVIQIQSIINPEDTKCQINRIMISVLSSDRTQVLAKSSVSSSNQQLFRSTYNSNLKYLNWFQGSSEILYNFATVQLISGSYSALLALKDITGSISRKISYTLASQSLTNFQLISSNNNQQIYPGQQQENIYIGCPSNSIPGLYTLIFSKTENHSNAVYGNIGLLNIIVSNSQNIISPQYTTYQVFAGGYSLPINFDLSNMLPFSGVSIQFTIVQGGTTDPQISLVDNNLSTVPQLTLNFSPTQPKGSILVRSAVSMPATAQTWSKLQMTIFGTDANAYTSTTTPIVLKLINPNPIPSFQYVQSVDQVSQLATQQNLNVQATLPCTVYYYIRNANGPVRQFAEVQNLVKNYVQLNPVDYFQQQYGAFNYENPQLAGAIQTFSISNLRSKMNYIITTWTQDQFLNVINQGDSQFSTKNNDGRNMKIPITFSKSITQAQKLTLVCFLCEQFAIPCLNVLSFDNIYCSQESQYQLSIVDSINQPLQRRLLEQQDNNENRQLVYSSSTPSNTVNFYTLSIDTQEQDISWNSIISTVQGSNFANFIQQNDLTLPSILSISTPKEVNQQTAPIFTSLPVVSSGITWIYIGGIQTSANSLIWMYLVNVTYGGTPSQQQMKYMLTSQNQTVKTFQIQYYDQVTPVSFNYTDLTNGTQYAFYYLATTENPSLFAPASSVSFVGQQTLNYNTTVSTHSQIIYFASLLSVLSIIIL